MITPPRDQQRFRKKMTTIHIQLQIIKLTNTAQLQSRAANHDRNNTTINTASNNSNNAINNYTINSWLQW
eukprot:m.47146 g.47146  ORF g.47146 m.47146 type:complete len:70 (+) comp7312_c2_seq2:2366-2575(+)